MFPTITKDVQKKYEEACKGTTPEDLPKICGYFGRTCRQMNNTADRMLCTTCPLKSFAEKKEDKL